MQFDVLTLIPAFTAGDRLSHSSTNSRSRSRARCVFIRWGALRYNARHRLW